MNATFQCRPTGISRVQIVIVLKNTWLCKFNENRAYATVATSRVVSREFVYMYLSRNSVNALEEVLEGQQDHISTNVHVFPLE